MLTFFYVNQLLKFLKTILKYSSSPFQLDTITNILAGRTFFKQPFLPHVSNKLNINKTTNTGLPFSVCVVCCASVMAVSIIKQALLKVKFRT